MKKLEELIKLITLSKITRSVGVLIITFIITKALDYVTNAYGKKYKRAQLLLSRFNITTRFILYGSALYFIVVAILRPSPEALIGLAGGSAVALGFAGKDYLANILAGLIILVEKPFRVGDRIQVGEFMGVVIDIGLRSFRLRTPNEHVTTVPNSVVLNSGVKSLNVGMPHFLVEIDVYVAPEIRVETVREILWEATVTSKYFFSEKPVQILVNSERYHIRYSVQAFVTDLRREWELKSDVINRAIQAFQDREIKFSVRPMEFQSK